MLTDAELRALFHQLWSQTVGTSGYSKEQWMKFQKALYARDVVV